MDLYSLIVESFTIHDTRSEFDDAVWLGVSAVVDGDVVDSFSKKLGEFDNGTYSVPAAVRNRPPVVINDPQSHATFIFQLLNNEHVSPDVVDGRVASTADQLAGIVAGLASVGKSLSATLTGPLFWAAIALEGIANLWSWLSTDCDGPIAIDHVTGPRYVLDQQTDNVDHSIRVVDKKYLGSDDLSEPCGKSNYDISWTLHHDREWMPAADAQTQLTSIAGAGAAAHNGMLHCFGVGVAGVNATHAVTLTGASWAVDDFGDFALATNLALSPVSFDDRLHLFGVAVDETVLALAYSIDGRSWYDETGSPPQLKTTQAIAAVEFRDRLYVFARDKTTHHLRVTSSSDIRVWLPWADLPAGGLAPQSAVAAATLDGTLHLFGIYDTGKRPAHVVVHTSTTDGHTWAGWDMVEAGLPPQDEPAAEPLDVSAGIHHRRVYVGARWQTVDSNNQKHTSMGLNFSGDGENWSGWRVPATYHSIFQPSAPTALAAVHNHLYVVSPSLTPDGDTTQVWAY